MQTMRIKFFLALFIIILIYPSSLIAATERRIALVIGNGTYDFGRLKNSVNDANDVAATLKKLGFSVILKNNVGHKEMEMAITEFGRQLKKDDVGIFFYAGHGVQIDSQNYLIPIGANIEEEIDVKYRAVNLSRILDVMDRVGNRLNIIILDACRNNPYAGSFRSTTRGLAIVERSPKDTLIAYSTSPNQVAIDGSGRNSPYTKALLENMTLPGIPIEQVFKKIRNSLDKVTRGKQVPWYISSLGGDFYFNLGRINQSEEARQLSEDKQNKIEDEKATLEGEITTLAMAKRPYLPAADETTGIELVFVQGGCYQMGDTFAEGHSQEKPAHEVCVSDFYMGKYEVTQSQWKKVMGWNPSSFNDCGDNCPVENVSWNYVQDFIHKLNSQSGKKYRLPTEAEWEYAARSGGKPEKWAGTSNESSLDHYAWYYSNSGSKSHPVGQKRPNGLGLYDMSGNVWEWCGNWYDSGYYKKSIRDNPEGPPSGSYRVKRGGSWSDIGKLSRSAIRDWGYPDYGYDNLGFRISLPIGQ